MIEWVSDCDSILGNILNSIITMVLVVVKYYTLKTNEENFLQSLNVCYLIGNVLKKTKTKILPE